MPIPFVPITITEVILGSIAFIVILAFGLAVYLKNPKSHTNILFFTLALILDAYIISTAVALHPFIKTIENNLFWIRIDMFLGSFIAPVLFLLAHTFPNNKISLSKKWLNITVIYTLIMAVVSFTALVFKSVSYPEGSTTPVPVPGAGMPFYFVHIIGYFSASFAILIRRYRKSLGIDKLKRLYFLVGIIMTFTGMAIVDFLLVLLGNTSLVYMGPIFPVFLMVLVGITIVKHQFLDIKPVIARAVSYFLVLLSLASIYFFLIFFGLNKFLGLSYNLPFLLTIAFFGVLTTLIFQPIRSLLIKLTDKIFFKGAYDSKKILSELTHAISNTIEFNDLAKKLLGTISQELRVDKVGIFTIANNKISDFRTIGYKNTKIINDKKIFSLFLNKNNSKHFFVIDDLDPGRKEFFHQHDIEALFPIWAEDQYVAILVLGTKLSGLPYSSNDISILDVFASESGIAIQNAKLYSDLQIALDAKSKFITVVSHQLRTPVSFIRWGLDELHKTENLNDKRELLEDSHQRVVFLNEQLDDILTVLDIYDKKLEITKTQIKSIDVIKKIISEFENEIKNKKLIINYGDENNFATIFADASKIKKVFEVVIKNAVLYSNINGQIIITCKQNGNFAEFTIHDNGLGITNEEKPYIFTEFYRGERVKDQIPDGLGLGMFIAKTFVLAHRGQILAESDGPNQGTEITIKLPLK